MKQGKVAKILAVEITCPTCGGICDTLDRGSSMIEEQDEIVKCEDCGEQCKVPANAWNVKSKSRA